MPTREFFADDFTEARAKFIDAAGGAGARLHAFLHPTRRAPDGGSLSVDVALIGASQARRCLLLLSGTHGVEGYAGSGCQVGFFRDRMFEAFDADSCVIAVHAINPFGFAWLRRVNEDNVDLNRNFQDFSRPLPKNAGYGELHELLIPADWDGAARAAADAALQAYLAARGLAALQAAVSGGQYTHPNGMFYGGSAATWSARTFKRLLATLIPASVTRLIALDVHTGLGQMGYGEPIFAGGEAGDFERARAYFGPEVVSMAAGGSASAVVTGSIAGAVAAWSPHCETTYLALEFGTRPLPEVLTALRGDHWLHARERAADALDESIRRRMRDAFYVQTPSWQAAVYGRTTDFVARAARALTAAPPPPPPPP
jgi:predicted deacylase